MKYAFSLLFLFIGQLAAHADLFRPIPTLSPMAGTAKKSNADDQQLVVRILNAYQSSTSNAANLGNAMWQYIFTTHHQEIDRIFKYENPSKAAEVLRNPKASNLFFGIDNLALAVSMPKEHEHAHALICLDKLVRFAELIGAVRLFNPEHPTTHSVWRGDDVVKAIEKTLGLTLSFPNPYPSESGVLTKRGIVSARTPDGLYQAWRIKQLVKGIERPRVLEIGAGVGRTAYYARLLGIEDYTIVDIPMTAAISGYFLGRTLGEECIALSGEKVQNRASRVKILSPEEFFSGSETYDLILNADSLTEMDPQTAQLYFKHIENRSDLFLSINHEINPFTVKELIDKSDKVAEVHRTLYPMRGGYIEEIIRLK